MRKGLDEYKKKPNNNNEPDNDPNGDNNDPDNDRFRIP